MGDVRNRDIEPVAAVRLAGGADRVVEVPGVLAVDGYEGDLTDVAAPLLVALEDLVAPAADLILDCLREDVRETVDHHGLRNLRAGVVRVADDLGDSAGVERDAAGLLGNPGLQGYDNEAAVSRTGILWNKERAVHRVAGLLGARVEVA